MSGNWRVTVPIGSANAPDGTPYLLRVDCITPDALAELTRLGDATVPVSMQQFKDHYSCGLLTKLTVRRG